MTGFGRAEGSREGQVLVAEVRSVNHRFLETSIRLPRGFAPHESNLRAYVSELVSRGKINLTVSWKGAHEEGGVLNLDVALAERYVEMLQETRRRFGFRDPVTLAQLLALPDLLVWEEPALEKTAAWELLREVVGDAMRELVGMREAEGRALAQDLSARATTLLEGVRRVDERAPERIKAIKERLRARVQDLLAGEAEVDTDRLLVEAAFQADRMDCTEETVRLKSHIEQLNELLRQGGPVGRKLNFLAQEMHREANTIGSKANDAQIAREVIRLKEEIEIVREQVQNIE